MKKILLAVMISATSGLGVMAQQSLTSVEPAPEEGSFFDYSTYQDINVYASASMSSFGSVTFSYLDQNIELEKNKYVEINGDPRSQLLQIRVAHPELINLPAQAAEAGADSFTLTIVDLKAGGEPVTENKLDNPAVVIDGNTITITYALAKAPQFMPEESYFPEVFYKYWQPGDESGKIIMVFSQPIASVASAGITDGQVYQSMESTSGNETEYTNTPIEPVIEDNTVSLDLTGIEWSSTDGFMTVMVQYVLGEDGLPVNFGEYGTSTYIHIPFENEEAPEAGVEGIMQDAKEGVYYNLQGMPVANPDKGIFIVNGKKVMK